MHIMQALECGKWLCLHFNNRCRNKAALYNTVKVAKDIGISSRLNQFIHRIFWLYMFVLYGNNKLLQL